MRQVGCLQELCLTLNDYSILIQRYSGISLHIAWQMFTSDLEEHTASIFQYPEYRGHIFFKTQNTGNPAPDAVLTFTAVIT